MKNHRKHMCELAEEGLDGWIRRLSDKPLVECRFCGFPANSLRNVCGVRMTELKPERIKQPLPEEGRKDRQE